MPGEIRVALRDRAGRDVLADLGKPRVIIKRGEIRAAPEACVSSVALIAMNYPAPSRKAALLVFSLLAVGLKAQAHKELGRMWTFENAPLAWFQEAYDFKPSVEWLDHARMSSLRLGDEKRSFCSASFVSPHGLIMTNHHCARDAVSKALAIVSKAEREGQCR